MTRLRRTPLGRRWAYIFAVAMLTAAIPAQSRAQNRSPAAFSDRWQAVETTEPKRTAQPQHHLPVSVAQALYLIRSTLLTLNDANRSGNYTVLHDLGAPGFRDKNSAADLAQIFVDLRRRHFDLFSVALAAPKLTAPPRLENNGMLRLTGFFPTRPLQINFDLLFQNVDHEWRLFGLSVATPQATPIAAQGKAKTVARK